MKIFDGLLILLLAFCCATNSFCQQKNFVNEGNIALDSDEVDSNANAAIFFHNINKTSYFYDKKQYENLKKLEKQQNWAELMEKLPVYVLSFGIENFQEDLFWIWRLAMLYEQEGDSEKAKFFYRMALKHHHSGMDIATIREQYQKITKNETSKYVDLAYYYELVEYRKNIDTLRPPQSVHLNMGDDVNSTYADYAPTLSSDDKAFIFTSKRNTRREAMEEISNEDLYITYKMNGNWQKAEPLKEINSRYNEGSAVISRDGNTIYFSRCHSPDGLGNCDIYAADRESEERFGTPYNLGEAINSKYWDSHPALSANGDTLYFSSDRLGGFGMADIYYAVKDKDGKWSKAKNAGPIINTRHNEVSPFVHPKNNTLYFSSNGQLINFGDFDIYKTRQLRPGQWEEPKNIGPLVNGEGAEFYFAIDASATQLYYAKSSTADMNNLDLYSFPLPMGAQPLAYTKLRGSLTDAETGKPFEGIVSIIDLDNGIEVAPRYINDDGSFEFDLINQNNYLLVIQGDAFFRIEELFYLDGDMEFNKTTSPISRKIKFESIEFANGKADILPEMHNDLNKIVDFMLDNPDVSLAISGHTDSDGTESLNLDLSQRRASAIRQYLIDSGGIDGNRITAEGFGSAKPLFDEASDENKRLNRRVEFEITRAGSEET